MPATSPIFVPMAMLAIWTMLVLLLVPIARFKAGKQGQVTVEDFRYGESGRVPDSVRLPNRNFMNLLEVPVLFYVVGFMAFLTGHVDSLMMGLAWTYVALRFGHSLVHLASGHNVFHRLTLFAVSNVVVSVMWWVMLYRLLSSS
ncbi:MAG: MAPEG family protein [Aquabacterium sp.]